MPATDRRGPSPREEPLVPSPFVSSAATTIRQPIALEIAGQRLRLNANAEPGHLERLALLVNERCDEMKRNTRSNVPATLLALVCLDLADELTAARRELDEFKGRTTTALEAAETRARDVESLARRAVTDAIQEIDRLLAQDEADEAPATDHTETA